MDKKVAALIKDTMGKGEKMAPVDSLKFKVKFQDAEDDGKDEKKAGKAKEKALKKSKK